MEILFIWVILEVPVVDISLIKTVSFVMNVKSNGLTDG